MQILYPYQGRQYNRVLQIFNLDGTPAVNVFNSGTTLSANVFEGQNQASIFQPTVTWNTTPLPPLPPSPPQTGYTQGQVSLSIAAPQTAALDPAGEYRLLVDTTTGGITWPGWEGRVKILATPGSVSPSPPDLITYDYAEAALSEIALSDTQRDFIPYLVSAASQAVRKYCFDRHFDLRTITEKYDVALDGTVRLYQVPVQLVLRVQGPPQLALTVANISSAVQSAQAYFSYTGSVGGYGTNAQTATGLYLSWVSSGVLSNTTISYTPGMTISTLAGLVNAVGSGWIAQTDNTPNGLGSSPVTELDGGFVSQGCAVGAIPGDGARFNILQDMTGARLDNPNRGFLWVGRQQENSLAARWGPGGDQMFGSSGNGRLGQVKVTYQAGFSTIPPDVQYWCGQLVKWKIEVSKQELLLMEEKAADYSYKLSEAMVAAMPPTVRQGLGQWRIHYA